ncbi:MAG: hypothetical protein EBS00_02320 [Verrucomicrobia bacterium]|nr:hypothetical protein [Verrucomicrobiota bacterium]
MKPFSKWLSLSLCLASLCLAGCAAYQWGGPKPAFRSIEIATVKNSTSRPGTHAVRDAKLETEIIEYSRAGQTTSSTDSYTYTSFRITIKVQCTLTTNEGKKVLFKNRPFSASATLQPIGDSAAEERSLGPTLFADIVSQIRQAATTAW